MNIIDCCSYLELAITALNVVESSDFSIFLHIKLCSLLVLPLWLARFITVIYWTMTLHPCPGQGEREEQYKSCLCSPCGATAKAYAFKPFVRSSLTCC